VPFSHRFAFWVLSTVEKQEIPSANWLTSVCEPAAQEQHPRVAIYRCNRAHTDRLYPFVSVFVFFFFSSHHTHLSLHTPPSSVNNNNNLPPLPLYTPSITPSHPLS
jgi:hypothetical protein